MDDQIKRIVVIGTSMGGLEAIKTFLPSLSPNLPIAIFIVQHIFEEAEPQLPFILKNFTDYKVKLAKNNEKIKSGTIYISTNNEHLLIDNYKIVLGNGIRENGLRPSINNLFRSAAASFNQKVIGIVMTGVLSDGTEGLKVIKELGGKTIVQDPREASCNEMPLSAIKRVQPDYIANLIDIGPLIRVLINEELNRKVYNASEDILQQLELARHRKGKSNERSILSDYSIEETSVNHSLYSVLQVMQERTNMLENMAESELIKGRNKLARIYFKRSTESRLHTENLRKHLQERNKKAS